MKKVRNVVLLLILVLGFTVGIAGCTGKDKPTKVDSTKEVSGTKTPVENGDVTIPDGNFDVDETVVEEVNLGEDYFVSPITVKDSKNAYHKAVVTVKDEAGKNYEITDSSFTPDHAGKYTVTYTITYGNNLTASKSFTVVAKDLEAPTLNEGVTVDNIALLGSEIDITEFGLIDNSGEDIQFTREVTFNGTKVEVNDNKFIASEKGAYVISLVGKDSSNNEADIKVYVHTLVDGEKDIALTSEYYPQEVSDAKSYNGSKSLKVSMFDKNLSWVNDFSILGSKCSILGAEPTYLSFWIYIDGKTLKDVSNIYKYSYYETICYDQYGNRKTEYYQFPNSYSIPSNRWHRLVLNLGEATNNKPDGGIECVANPKSFSEIAFGFGAWDNAKGANVSIVQDVYIDDIRLTNTLEDEVYWEEFTISLGSVTQVKVEKGKTQTLTATVPEKYAGLGYESNDTGVATVDENGVVTGVSAGPCEITITSKFDPTIKAKVPVEVEDKTSTAAQPDTANQTVLSNQYGLYNPQKEASGNWVTTNTLADYCVGFGSYDNFQPMVFSDSAGGLAPAVDAPTGEAGGTVYQTWRVYYNKDVAAVYGVKAKQHCFVRILEQDTPINGWVEGVATYATFDKDGKEVSKTTVNMAGTAATAGKLTSKYIELQAGEMFVWAVNSNGGTRNIQNCPSLVIAPVLSKE